MSKRSALLDMLMSHGSRLMGTSGYRHKHYCATCRCKPLMWDKMYGLAVGRKGEDSYRKIIWQCKECYEGGLKIRVVVRPEEK